MVSKVSVQPKFQIHVEQSSSPSLPQFNVVNRGGKTRPNLYHDTISTLSWGGWGLKAHHDFARIY